MLLLCSTRYQSGYVAYCHLSLCESMISKRLTEKVPSAISMCSQHTLFERQSETVTARQLQLRFDERLNQSCSKVGYMNINEAAPVCAALPTCSWDPHALRRLQACVESLPVPGPQAWHRAAQRSAGWEEQSAYQLSELLQLSTAAC